MSLVFPKDLRMSGEEPKIYLDPYYNLHYPTGKISTLHDNIGSLPTFTVRVKYSLSLIQAHVRTNV